jgi:hypothetical protein
LFQSLEDSKLAKDRTILCYEPWLAVAAAVTVTLYLTSQKVHAESHRLVLTTVSLRFPHFN